MTAIPPAGRDAPTMRCQLCGNTYVGRHICSAFTTPAAVSPDAPEPRAERYELYEPCGARCMGARCTRRPGHDGAHRDSFEEASWQESGAPCGASWTADYGALPCDLPRGHQSQHRTYGSQGVIRFADDCARVAAAPRPAGPTPEGVEWTEEDATNIVGLIRVCENLQSRLVPHGASARGWDDCIATLRKAGSLVTALATARAALDESKKPVPCGVCLGQPLKSGKPCVCGGVGTEQAEMHGLRVALFDAQAALSEATRDTTLLDLLAVSGPGIWERLGRRYDWERSTAALLRAAIGAEIPDGAERLVASRTALPEETPND